jgi:uncharacterized protein YjbI with pentapeptide repeats
MNYLKNIKNKYNIELFPLNDTETTRKIRDINKKNKTVLLLDALDEDPQIHQNFSYRLKEIIERTEGFYKVIITCNPQLFQMKIAKNSNRILYHSKEYDPTNLIKTVFQMIQILPFTDEQIFSYIKKKYKNTDPVKFQRSQQIIKSLPKLFSKPIMFHYIDILVQKDITVKYSYEIFKEFVYLFLDQEGKNIKGITRNTLKACYKVIAFAMYNKKNEQGSDYMSKREIQALGKKYNIDIFDICCNHKGLLKHSNDFYTFIHLSIMEYLVAESILSGHFPDKKARLSKQIFLFLYEMIEKESPFKKNVPPKPGLFRYLWSAGIDMKSLNLQNANLAGTNFSDLNIDGLNLNGSDLQGAEFYLTTIKDTNFTKANLNDVTFRRTKIKNVNMSKCTFNSAKFNNCKVIKSVFYHATLSESFVSSSDFTESEFANADMSSIKIRDSIFKKSNLQYTDLQNCDINKSEFQRCVFTKSKFLNAKLFNVILNGCLVNECDLAGASLSNSDLKYSVFNSSNLKNCKLNSSDLSGADLNFVNLQNSNLESSILNGADLSKSDLSKANLSKVSMNRANLRGCVMPGINFTDTLLNGISLNGVNLYGANFSNADLREADLRDADLRKANFTNANIKYSDLRVSDLAEAIMSFEQLVTLKSFDFARISLNLYKQIRVDWPEEQPKPMGVRHD